jgi:hypothetical protein
MTHQRQGKYKQRDYEMVKIYQPLVYCYSEHIETGWQHTETISADRGLEVQVRKAKPDIWTPDMLDFVKVKYRNGDYSMSGIVFLLNKKFGTKFTRNEVTEKLVREGKK